MSSEQSGSGEQLFMNQQSRSIRRWVLLLLGNILLFAGLIFAVEIIVIFLGIGNVFLPWTHQILNFLNKLLF